MIERYSDHAANERTFLAWVRTAIAIMAFGFLVQKFDLFLRITAGSLAARSSSTGSQIVGNLAGLLLIVLGGVVMAFAAIRLRKTTRDIDAKEVRPGPGGAARYYTRRAPPLAGGHLIRLSDIHGHQLALTSARRLNRNSGFDAALPPTLIL